MTAQKLFIVGALAIHISKPIKTMKLMIVVVATLMLLAMAALILIRAAPMPFATPEFGFHGDHAGYVNIPLTEFSTAGDYSIRFDINTEDVSGSLFFAGTEKTYPYLDAYVTNGYLKFVHANSAGDNISLLSNDKISVGKWVTVYITRVKDEFSLGTSLSTVIYTVISTNAKAVTTGSVYLGNIDGGLTCCIKNIKLNDKSPRIDNVVGIVDFPKCLLPSPVPIIQAAFAFSASTLGYLKIPIEDFPQTTVYELEFDVKTVATSGMIMYVGTMPQSFASIVVLLDDGYARVNFYDGSNYVMGLRSYDRVNNGRWNRVKIDRQSIEFVISTSLSDFANKAVGNVSAISVGDVYVGALPDKTIFSTVPGLDGCVKDLKFDWLKQQHLRITKYGAVGNTC